MDAKWRWNCYSGIEKLILVALKKYPHGCSDDNGMTGSAESSTAVGTVLDLVVVVICSSTE